MEQVNNPDDDQPSDCYDHHRSEVFEDEHTRSVLPETSWGDCFVSVGHDPLLGSWFYMCPWGCFAYDFKSERAAQRALNTHDCKGKRP